MTAQEIKRLIERVGTWPKAWQEELAHIVDEIEGELGETYSASPEELESIDRGLKAADEGRFATDEQVEAVFSQNRRA